MTTILQNEQIAPGIFRMVLHAPDIARKAVPGQFVNIKIADGAHILRRPISICDCDKVAETCTLVYEVRGDGTKWLSLQGETTALDILGPLGNGFPLIGDTLLLIGGGIGVFPLLYTAKMHSAKKKIAVLGFRTKAQAVLLDEFSAVCEEVILCTEDGSLGQKGFVTGPLLPLFTALPVAAVSACGPKAMLRAVTELCLSHGIDPHVSMEERMGCGFGACLVCACALKAENGVAYAHCCTDGPVFLGSSIAWNA